MTGRRLGLALALCAMASPLQALGVPAAVYWLSFQISTDTGFTVWDHVWMLFAIVSSLAITVWAGNREVKRKLEPRRERLREAFDAGA
jgi:hypothetical protein